MSAKSILEEYARKTGWNESSMLEILCAYVDDLGDDEDFEEYVSERAEEETAECDDDVGEDGEEEDVEVDGQ